MEDNEKPSTTSPPAARTAQALRELHERARTALAAQRERMGQLEAQLTHQLDTIADTLAQQLSSHGGSNSQVQETLHDVEQLRAELERTRLEWDRERETWQSERAELVAAEQSGSQSLDERGRDLEVRQQALDERASELNQQDREQRLRQEALDAHAAQSAAKQEEIFAAESALEKRRGELAELEAQAGTSQSDLAARHEELTNREQSLRQAEEAVAADRTALQAERDALAQQINTHSAEHAHRASETSTRVSLMEQTLQSERAAWEKERGGFEEQRRLLAKERDDLSTALEAARSELAVARETAATAAGLESVQAELKSAKSALESSGNDILKLRARVAELELESANRPATNDTDAVELVHLRAERDAMSERIAELETKCTELASAAPAESSDLQRRFELAMEDVRELKHRNAELEAELATAKAGGGCRPSAPSIGGNSWEAMKKKMLANLEDEGDGGDAERQVERAKIQDTIRATDDVIARKDKELEQLRGQLAEGGGGGSVGSVSAVDQLLDTDAVIAEHRANIAKLEQEIREKLREAELELSVERAKITRETAHLAGLKADIDAHRASGVDVHAGPGTAQQPKRRWLSKLGLSGEEDEK